MNRSELVVVVVVVVVVVMVVVVNMCLHWEHLAKFPSDSNHAARVPTVGSQTDNRTVYVNLLVCKVVCSCFMHHDRKLNSDIQYGMSKSNISRALWFRNARPISLFVDTRQVEQTSVIVNFVN
jgi:hypothetical protein